MGTKKHQVKTQWYYWFWGTATVAVVAGQLYVGSGYRQMSRSFNRIIDTIVITIEGNSKQYDKYRFLKNERQEGRQTNY
tara:strand:- start:524 stop:760 length:237 start_codon:yes stop_codon:yes gene_type:complete